METVGDITKIKAESVPNHDLLTAGFPCQSFSVAGKRLGFEDARGTLFFEVARIAKAKQPKVILLENVKGLINHDKGKTLNTIIQTLCDIGYTIDFEVLNSKYFGVPQNRERMFIVAIRDDLVTPELWINTNGNIVVPKGKRRIQKLDGVKTFNFDYPPQERVAKRLRDILESNVDKKYYLSEEKTAKLVESLEDKDKIVGTIGHHPFSKKFEFKGCDSEISPLKEGIKVIGRLSHINNDKCSRVYGIDGVSPSLLTAQGGNNEPKVSVLQQFSNGQGISHAVDANYMKGTSPGDVGKGRRTHVLEEVRPVLTPDRLEKCQNGRRFKENDEPMFTLTSQDRYGIAIREATKQGYAVAAVGDAVNFQFPESATRRGRFGEQIAQTLETQCNQGVVTPKYRIRKLTPLECFRLQAFPDEYYEILSANGISNSQLYKMAGNAVTVNVVETIGKRLLKYLQIEGETT